MKRIYKFLIYIFLSVGFIAASYFVPWKDIAEKLIKNELIKREITGLEFKLDSLGVKEVLLKDISYAGVSVPSFKITYDISEIIDGKFHEITVDNIIINKDKFNVELKNTVFSELSGKWRVGEINLTSPSKMPPFFAEGEYSFSDSKFLLSGEAVSVDRKIDIKFDFNYNKQESKLNNLLISSLSMAYSGGVISAKNISIPLSEKFDEKTPISTVINVSGVKLDELLSALVGDGTTASGEIYGEIPVVINRDGSFFLKKGNLKTKNEGILKISPDSVPSNIPEVEMIRSLLANFHYNALSIEIASADNKKLAAVLRLEGNNPDVYDGRSVKLNINLSGDIMELITKSAFMLK